MGRIEDGFFHKLNYTDMASYSNFYQTDAAANSKGRLEQLLQLLRIVWDGDIIDKTERDELIKSGLAQKAEGGFNLITPKGIQYLSELGIIHP